LVSAIEKEGSIQIKEDGDSYLLICYDNGFVNKVKLSSLQVSVGDVTNYYNNIEQIVVVSNDDALGVFFKEGYRKLFKAHLINDIQEFDKLLSSGTQVVYNNEFEDLKYVIIPSYKVNDIDRLVFTKFKALGKSVASKKYAKEFEVIGNY
jgi:hypothetical protein